MYGLGVFIMEVGGRVQPLALWPGHTAHRLDFVYCFFMTFCAGGGSFTACRAFTKLNHSALQLSGNWQYHCVSGMCSHGHHASMWTVIEVGFLQG